MHMESTLGGLSISADGSSWPTTGPGVLRDINTKIGDEELKKILRRMACGIMEVHVNMVCMFVSAMPYFEHAEDDLADQIYAFKQKLKCTESLESLQASFEAIEEVHRFILEIYDALRAGEVRTQETVLGGINERLSRAREVIEGSSPSAETED